MKNSSSSNVDSSVARITKYHIDLKDSEQLKTSLSNYVLNALNAQGNIMAEAYTEEIDLASLWLVERWIDDKSYNANKQTDQAKELEKTVKELTVSSPEVIEVKDLEPLSKEAWRKAPKKSDSPQTVMLFVSANPGTQQVFTERYHIAMPEFRSEPGVVTYQLTQIKEDDTKFITYEKFRNADALQEHLKFPPTQPVLDYLHTSIVNPPFENNIHKLTEFAPLIRE